MSRPAVSVIVPTYDRANLLADAIESICAQGVGDLEIVVVDDGSSDGTESLLASLDAPIRYLRQEHKGVSAARNRGLAAAAGGLIAFLDSDDVWPAGSLPVRRAFLDARPDVEVVHGRTRVVDRGASHSRSGVEKEARPTPLLGSMLCRRSVFDLVGPFDEELHHAEDVEWLARMKEKGVSVHALNLVTLEYRIHGGNMTRDVAQNQAFLMRALKRSLDRRRG